jgi:hypothetical protein
LSKSSLALIGTFHKKYEESVRAVRAVYESSYLPDEIYWVCENTTDHDNLMAAGGISDFKVHLLVVPTPRTESGDYLVVPYSYKHNWVLGKSNCDRFTYLDNGSIPHRLKYERMMATMDANTAAHAVYCSQQRTGYMQVLAHADAIVENASCVLNYTQVMHRRSDARWSEDMALALPFDVVDADFWQRLSVPFHPVQSEEILDWHYIASPAADL